MARISAGTRREAPCHEHEKRPHDVELLLHAERPQRCSSGFSSAAVSKYSTSRQRTTFDTGRAAGRVLAPICGETSSASRGVPSGRPGHPDRAEPVDVGTMHLALPSPTWCRRPISRRSPRSSSGFFAKEGLDATIELIFPVTKTFEELREGASTSVGGAAHAALYAFRDWRGCKLLCALSQNMYWFLVVRARPGREARRPAAC